MASIVDKAHNHQVKLDFDPFDPQEPTSHFFTGGNRQDLLDQLVETCCYSSDLAAVTGPLGSGKSTLAQWLAMSLDDDFVVVVVPATLFMSAEQLLEAACDELSLETAEGASTVELVGQLDQYAETLRARSKTLQLLVDDAHELGEEALQVILELLERQADSSRLGDDGIKVVLFGESMLLNSVQQVFPSAHITFELEPLAADEVVDYVAFKLACAGYQGKFPLDIDVMTVIEARSQGIPGAINVMVKDELGVAIAQRSSLQRRLQPNLGFLERHLVAASMLFGGLLLTLFFTLGGNNPGQDGEMVIATSGSGSSGTGSAPQRIQVPLDIPAALNRRAAADIDADRLLAVANDASERRPAAKVLDMPSVTGGREQPAPSEPADALELAGGEAADSVDSRDGGSGRVSASGSAADNRRENAAATAVEVRQQALLAKSPDSYTLQLLGSHSEANVKNFMASNSAATELSYFESRYQDRPWFVVVHGNYADRSTARAAIDRLPPALQELQPWARNLADIQADIRSHR